MGLLARDQTTDREGISWERGPGVRVPVGLRNGREDEHVEVVEGRLRGLPNKVLIQLIKAELLWVKFCRLSLVDAELFGEGLRLRSQNCLDLFSAHCPRKDQEDIEEAGEDLKVSEIGSHVDPLLLGPYVEFLVPKDSLEHNNKQRLLLVKLNWIAGPFNPCKGLIF